MKKNIILLKAIENIFVANSNSFEFSSMDTSYNNTKDFFMLNA